MMSAPLPESEPEPAPEAAPVFRQMRLFAAENPMRHRFPRAFLQDVPHLPGVYYFRDADQRLLYVGQSHDLRKRVGSYRHVHPDRHPRRLVRLVHAVRHITWEVCGSPAAAIAREKELLLELRPGFNRAGVWQPPPWWLTVQQEGRRFRLLLIADADRPEETGAPSLPVSGVVTMGPFASSFRWVHAALVRCLHRWLFPEVPLHRQPPGLMQEKAPRSLDWTLPLEAETEAVTEAEAEGVPGTEAAASGNRDLIPLLQAFLLRQSPALLEELQNLVTGGTPPLEKEFWLGQLEILAKFSTQTSATVPVPMTQARTQGIPSEARPPFAGEAEANTKTRPKEKAKDSLFAGIETW